MIVDRLYMLLDRLNIVKGFLVKSIVAFDFCGQLMEPDQAHFVSIMR